MTSRNVILDHDGGVDDFVALALLAATPKVNLLGCIVTNADCFVDPAAEVSAKLLATLGLTVTVAKSTLEAVHPFPTEWRRLAYNIRDFPCLNTLESDDAWNRLIIDTPGQENLAQQVMNATTPVTIIVTGPLSNVAYGITKYGSKFTQNIDQLIAMGGSLDVKGNVHVEGDDRFAKGTDNTQEWNFYWDAPAVKAVVDCTQLEGKKIFFGLDATNDVPITSDFVQQFGKQKGVMSQFVGCAYSLTTHWQQAYGRTYFAWDVLTVVWWLNSDVVKRVEQIPVAAEAREGHPSEGRVHRVGDNQKGNLVGFAFAPNAKLFYDTVLATCRGVQ